MPNPIPYDASRRSLLFPELGATVIEPGQAPDDARLCVEAARLAYKKGESGPQALAELKGIFTGIGLPRFELLDEADTQAFLAASDDLAVLAFRGTEQKVGDFASDLDARQVSWPAGGKVHSGFAHAYEAARKTIDTWLAAGPRPRRLLLTGHSLGAALATLAASLHRPDGLYTFGSPLVGDEGFARTVTCPTFRHVDCCDLICRVPPKNLLGERFEHVTEPIYIDSAGRVGGNIDPHDQMRAREEYILHYAWRRGTVTVRDLADHAPINYVSAVWGLRA